MRRPPIPRPDGKLRFQRVREPFWRWRVWAIWPDGYEFPSTRSGFWTRAGASGFAVELTRFTGRQGYHWRYEVRRVR